MSSGVSLAAWGESGSLSLASHPCSDGVIIKMPYRVDFLIHQPALYPIFSVWLVKVESEPLIK